MADVKETATKAAASMRPRHKAAEYRFHRLYIMSSGILASMRPRHKAAEYSGRGARVPRMDRRFNEAAA